MYEINDLDKITIKIYGKHSCGLCTSAEKKLKRVIETGNLDSDVDLMKVNIDADPVAAAEMDFIGSDVIPTIAIFPKHDDSFIRKLWVKDLPSSESIKNIIKSFIGEG